MKKTQEDDDDACLSSISVLLFLLQTAERGFRFGRTMLSISKAGKRKFPAEEFNSDNTKINLITQTKLSDDARSSESRFVLHLFFFN